MLAARHVSSRREEEGRKSEKGVRVLARGGRAARNALLGRVRDRGDDESVGWTSHLFKDEAAAAVDDDGRKREMDYFTK